MKINNDGEFADTIAEAWKLHEKMCWKQANKKEESKFREMMKAINEYKPKFNK